MTSDKLIQHLIDNLSKVNSFRRQVLLEEEDNEISNAFAKEFRRKLSKLHRFCVVELDVRDYDNFNQLLRALVTKTGLALGASGKNDGFPAFDDLMFNNPNRVRTHFLLAIGRITKKGRRPIFIFKHYEEATDRWLGGFGYIRSLLTRFPVSALVFTSKPMNEVSDEPSSGSPLWNIFNDLDDDSRVEDKFFLGFIGKGRYLRQLNEHAGSKFPTHLSLYGLPHVGKSELVEKWKETITGGNGNIGALNTKFGEKKLFFIHIPELHETSTYSDVVDIILGQIKDNFKKDYKEFFRRNAPDPKNTTDFDQAISTSSEVDPVTITQRLREVVDYINGLQIRVILILDEFEKTEETWKEKDYRQFCKLLLDTNLDLFCIIVSRPHLSYIVSEHIYQLMPFETKLVESLTDRELKTYLRRLWRCCELDNRGLRRSDPNNLKILEKPIRRLLTSCGKNPYLLDLASLKIINNCRNLGQKSFDEIVQESLSQIENKIKALYFDTAKFMHDEEAKKLQSFSHIVKCYFGTSADYDDVIDRFFMLGYVEKIGVNELLAETCKSFARYDDNGVLVCYYTTICQGFINYLYETQLNEITDIRELFTGLVHSLRYITEENLEKRLPILSGQPWFMQLMNCFFAYDPDKKCNVQFDNLTRELLPNRGISRMVDSRDQKLDFYDRNRFQISKASLDYAKNALKNGGNGSDILDAISLMDHASIICQYSDVFSPYFCVVGDINSDNAAMRLLRDCLTVIQEHIRNPLSHYSRKKQPSATLCSHRELCIALLGSIYGGISAGEPVEDISGTPIVNVSHGSVVNKSGEISNLLKNIKNGSQVNVVNKQGATVTP